MGVPKFFRWLSERYPLINEVIDSKTLVPPVGMYECQFTYLHSQTISTSMLTVSFTVSLLCPVSEPHSVCN